MPTDIYRRLGNSDEIENMVSNLPLLFAGGYPTSLDKITESQLEKFIPFMVQCSLGDIQSPTLDSSCEPKWWPEDVPFTIPLQKPPNCIEWLDKLKEIVAICYQFHKSVFLLRFCENLSAYQPESLRFINNYNSTTSLFDRVSNKLLVTFRNENMLYDQQRLNNKKTLMPKMLNSQSGEVHQMVEQSCFDIFLCDYCDAELYSADAYDEHVKKKICHGENIGSDDDDDDNDDVIFIEDEPVREDEQNSFLQHFSLCKNTPAGDVKPFKAVTPHKRNNNNNTLFSNQNSTGKNLETGKSSKVRRLPRRAPGVMAFIKDQPITSPAGQRLIAQSNTSMTNEYIRERVERYERFCSRNEDVAFLERIQLQQTNCKPIRVRVQRLSNKEIETLKTQVKTSQVKRHKPNPRPTPTAPVDDVINLISDSETDDEESENSHDSSEDKSTSTNYGRRANTVQPSHNTLLFVDCGPIIDPRLQLNTSRSQYDSTANLIVKKQPQPSKIYTSTHRHVDFQRIQQDKENRIFSFISEQSNNPQSAAYLYPEDDLNMVQTTLATNVISIDLTL